MLPSHNQSTKMYLKHVAEVIKKYSILLRDYDTKTNWTWRMYSKYHAYFSIKIKQYTLVEVTGINGTVDSTGPEFN